MFRQASQMFLAKRNPRFFPLQSSRKTGVPPLKTGVWEAYSLVEQKISISIHRNFDKYFDKLQWKQSFTVASTEAWHRFDIT